LHELGFENGQTLVNFLDSIPDLGMIGTKMIQAFTRVFHTFDLVGDRLLEVPDRFRIRLARHG
jgi:hypothetical protein